MYHIDKIYYGNKKMEFMSKTYTNLWKGKINLESIKINYNEKYNFQPDDYLKNKRDEFWLKDRSIANEYVAITSSSEYFVKILGNIVIADYARGKSKQLQK